MSWSAIQGDCRDVLRSMADTCANQFHACVTDPPYHLTSIVKRFGKTGSAPAQYGTDGLYARQSRGFMGKLWDGGDVAFQPETWRLVYGALRPGGHLLAFGGTRTYHRLVCAIEDAGFEIRDCVLWAYGTGFPKSHNMRDQWKGWGSALKPAVEMVVMARKPLIGTIAQNVTAYGTGALNIDESRVPMQSNADRESARLGGAAFVPSDNSAGRWPANLIHDGSECVVDLFPSAAGQPTASRTNQDAPKTNKIYGKFEHNPVPMEPRVEDNKSASRFFKSCRDGEDSAERRYTDNGVTNFAATPGLRRPDEPDKAKLFYAAKAGKTDRAGSMHPTVKPLALMRYLIKLVTVPGGYVLDPFAGSGTTLQAAVECGMNVLGIEAEAEYHADILRRMENIKSAAEAAD